MFIGVKNITKGTTKRKTNYYIFDGYIDGKVTRCKIWKILKEIQNGFVIEVENVKEEEYGGKTEYIIENYSIVNDYKDKLNLFGIKNANGEDFLNKSLKIINSIVKDKDYLGIIDKFLNDYKKDFCLSTGAKGIHHACEGGLSEHTYEVVKTCESFIDIYGDKIKNKDLLISSAFLHDIGKILTYDKKDEIVYEYSEIGVFCDHLFLGCEMLTKYLENISAEKSMFLKHCILSHHGKREWGSPVVPIIIEAHLLHYADNISAKVSTIETMINEHSDKNSLFTKGNIYLDGGKAYVGEY